MGFAALIGAKYVIEETTETADPNFIQNSKSRCYYCKTHLFYKAWEIANTKGFNNIAEGSNLDDMYDFRLKLHREFMYQGTPHVVCMLQPT